MRKIQEILIIIGIVCLLFIPVFIRPEPVGIDDPFYYFNYVFHKTNSLPQTTNLDKILIFNNIPADMLIIKIILLINFIISMVIFYHICRLYSKRFAMLTTLFLSSFVFFSGVLIRLESASFGIPFMLLSLYFITKYQQKEVKKTFDINIIISLCFLFISVNIWKFTIFLIPVYLIITNWNKIYLLATGIVVVAFPFLINYIIPNFTYSETSPFSALIPIVILSPIFLLLKDSKNKFGIILLLICSILVNKFIILLIPILILDLNSLLSKYWSNRVKLITIYMLCIVFIGSIISISIQPPTREQSILFDQVKLLKEPVTINWSYGYYAIWKGIDTNYYGNYKKQDYNGLVLTANFDRTNGGIKKCRELEKAGTISLYYCNAQDVTS